MIRLLYFLPLLLAVNASAQSVIKGTVHDVKDRQPLAGVTVFWLHLPVTAMIPSITEVKVPCLFICAKPLN